MYDKNANVFHGMNKVAQRISKGLRKYLRKAKAEIRRTTYSEKERQEKIQEVYKSRGLTPPKQISS